MTDNTLVTIPSAYPRAAEHMFAKALASMRVVAVTGPRQVGKSTFVREAAGAAERPYYTLDDLEIRQMIKGNRSNFLLRHPKMTIDEVQRDPELLLSVKIAVDPPNPSLPGRFVLTGSANLLMMKGVADSLAGRALYITLWPLTRREQLGMGTTGIWSDLLREDISKWYDLVNDQNTPQEDWRSYAKRGGFPEPTLHMKDEDSRELWYKGYLETFLNKDLPDLLRVDNNLPMLRLMQLCSLRIGNVLNQASLANDANMSSMMIHRYLDVLETAYQIVRIQPYTVNRTKRLIKSPKLYWNDSALALQIGREQPTGAHFENAILMDLLAWKDSVVRKPNILYWRTTTGHEIDFVIEDNDRLIGIEVKSSSNPGAKDFTNLKIFEDEYPDKIHGSLLLHNGNTIYWAAPKILAVPWWKIV